MIDINHPTYQNLPEPLRRNFYAKYKKNYLLFHHELPRGKRDKGTRMMQWITFGVFMVLSSPFFFIFLKRLNSGEPNFSLIQVSPFLFFMLFFLYFLVWDQHLGELLISGKKYTFPKKGIRSLQESGSVWQSVISGLIFLYLLLIAPWFFALALLLAAIIYQIYRVSWKKPPSVKLSLSKETYFLGEQLEFSIISEAEQDFTYVHLVNIETITIRKEWEREKWFYSKRKRSSDTVSRVVYMDWEKIEKGVSTYSFSIPREHVLGTNFDNPKAKGWLLLLEIEQINGHDSPYLMPIFER